MKITQKVMPNYFLARVLATRAFWLTAGFILVLMSLDMVHQVRFGLVFKEAFASSFLAAASKGNQHLYQMLVLVMLPVYLYVAIIRPLILDIQSGHRLMIIARMGLKGYRRQSLLSVFILGCGMIFLLLGLNYLVVSLAIPHLPQDMVIDYWESFGTNSLIAKQDPELGFVAWQVNHSFLAFLLYAGATALLSGLVSMLMLLLARFFKKGYQVLVLAVIGYYLITTLVLQGAKGIQPFLGIQWFNWLSHMGGLLLALGILVGVLAWTLAGEEELIA